MQFATEKLNIVAKADKNVFGVFPHVGIKETGDDTHHHGVDYKGQKEKQAGQKKQITCSRLSAYQRPAHAGSAIVHNHVPFLEKSQ